VDHPSRGVTAVGGVTPDAHAPLEERQQQPPRQDPTWTFARAADELTIVRPANAEGCDLVVTLNQLPRTFTFRDEQATTRFQSDMETLLTHTGWSFVGFRPERRTPGDRRNLPRTDERRRWWTDGWLFFGDR